MTMRGSVVFCCFRKFSICYSFLYFSYDECSFFFFFFFSSRRRHTRFDCDWSSDVCSSDLEVLDQLGDGEGAVLRHDHAGGGAALVEVGVLDGGLDQGEDLLPVAAAGLHGLVAALEEVLGGLLVLAALHEHLEEVLVLRRPDEVQDLRLVGILLEQGLELGQGALVVALLQRRNPRVEELLHLPRVLRAGGGDGGEPGDEPHDERRGHGSPARKPHLRSSHPGVEDPRLPDDPGYRSSWSWAPAPVPTSVPCPDGPNGWSAPSFEKR